MRFAGLVKTSLIDYPREVSSVIFTQGCNFRCGFCHNPGLVDPARYAPEISENDIMEFLKTRIGKSEVVITGGEPTLHPDLFDFVSKVKALGFKVKLDTNGSQPRALERLMNGRMVDYVAMDLKAPWPRYAEAVCADIRVESVRESVALLIGGAIPYEFRSTLVPGLHAPEDVAAMAESIRGATAYYLQNARPGENVNPAAVSRSFSGEEMDVFLEAARRSVANAALR